MLKSYFLNLLVIVVVVTAQRVITDTDPKEEQEKRIKTGANQDPGVCTKDYSCVDCYKARVCAVTEGSYAPKLVFNCSETSPTTPYCNGDTGTCTAIPPVNCAPAGNFTCLKDGTYPDPTDCTRYFICLNGFAYAYKCDKTGQNYDSSREACASGTTCYTFNCRGKNGVKIAYGKTATIFAYCFNGSAFVVDKCPGNYELNADSQKCEPVCYAEGYIPDVAHCNRYYKCVKSAPYSTTYVITNEECPGTLSFDAVNLRCVAGRECPTAYFR